MTFFKIGKIHYVTTIKPQPLLSEEVVEEAQAIRVLLQAHPALSRDQIVEKLEIDASNDEAVAHALQPLSWLVDRGHIIEFLMECSRYRLNEGWASLTQRLTKEIE